MKDRSKTMHKLPTIFLRAVIAIMGFAVIIICALILPYQSMEWAKTYPDVAYLQYPILTGLLGTLVPFLIAIYHAINILQYIDEDKPFSKKTIKSVRTIKFCALVISGIYLSAMPIIIYMANQDDAPGLAVIGLFFALAPFVIAVFAEVMQRLLSRALELKSENDLTV